MHEFYTMLLDIKWQINEKPIDKKSRLSMIHNLNAIAESKPCSNNVQKLRDQFFVQWSC